MIQKRYTVKLFGINGVYKNTINPKTILSEISFSQNINGGQGQLSLKLAVDFNYSGITFGDVIKVFLIDENNTNIQVYTGIVSKINREYSGNFQGITVVCLGLFAFMNRIFFKDGANYLFSKNQDPAQTIKDVVDYFNTIYTAGFLSYTGVSNYGSSINIEFDYKKCNQAIQDLQKATESFYFFVGADGNFTYQEKDNTVIDHYFTLENDILALSSDEDVETLANNVFVDYSGGVSNKSDATSQTTYGLIETKATSQLNDVGSANIYAQDYLDQNKEFKKEIVLTVNNKYNIESIKPGDYVKVRNSKYEIDGIQILKTDYSFDKVICYLDSYSTLPQEISLIST